MFIIIDMLCALRVTWGSLMLSLVTLCREQPVMQWCLEKWVSVFLGYP